MLSKGELLIELNCKGVSFTGRQGDDELVTKQAF